jgi:GTP-binding protein Era
VGKSTLVNALVGEKISIVSAVPQTTRNRIRGICNTSGAQVVLLDTPGIHRPLHRMNRKMVDSALDAGSGVDLIYLMVDAEGIGPGDRFVITTLRADGPPVFLVLNKVDKVRRTALLPMLEQAAAQHPFAELIPVSAKTGESVERLLQETVKRMPEGPPLFAPDMMTDQSERFLVAEIVREKVFLLTRKEIPHSTAVLVELWEETEDQIRIEATVIVEKDNQKGILIGRGGSMLKRIGTDARADIEKLLGRHIFLALHVKVSQRWRESPVVLEQIGLL